MDSKDAGILAAIIVVAALVYCLGMIDGYETGYHKGFNHGRQDTGKATESFTRGQAAKAGFR